MSFDIMPAAVVLLVVQGASTGYEAIKTYKDYSTPPGISGVGISHTEVRAGDKAVIEWTLTKEVDCPGTSSRVWRGEDGFYIVEPRTITALPMNPEPVVYSIETTIPALAPVGDLTLEVIGEYNCGDILGAREFTLGPVHINVIE